MELWSNFKAFIASPAEGFTAASTFVFNLVFCATTATIVSGAMAERTKFSAYCIYSAVISLFIYPIEAHWIWGGGWLSQLGFHDYAGSCAIHMVGGIAALVGAIFLGPRIGKYVKDASGKVVKVNAIPGHIHHPGRPGRVHPVAGLVRLQRRGQQPLRLSWLASLPDHQLWLPLWLLLPPCSSPGSATASPMYPCA